MVCGHAHPGSLSGTRRTLPAEIRVADAIGALGRARAAIVVGDSRQMPPTAFGGAGQEDGEPGSSEEQDVPDDEESILSECVQARVPQSWLSWHYRSQDEALIAFSNRLYYDGRLASFPAPPGRGTGVSFRRVDGAFLRSGRVGLRTNPVEARAVVDEVLTRFARSPGEPPSLGVVTFNVQQRDLIDELLRAADDPAVAEALDRDDDRGLFVKNLENVQGDERDAVLFSIGFSRNDKGALPLNFGPLNRVGGERRLNVAVTRARREVVVFCSFDPAGLRDSSAVGVGHLRAYLEMAARGVAASGDVAPAPAPTDRHRDDVAAALRERGLVVRTDVGLSDFRLDLTLAHRDAPDDPVVAVLLDGPGWASRRTVGDRDGMPRVVLGDVLGWPAVERVWLPQWLAEREQVVERLLAAVEAARPVTAAPAEPESEPDTENLALALARPVFVEDPPTTEVMATPLRSAPLTNAHAADEADSPAVPPPPAAPSAPAAADEGSPADDGALVFTPWSPAAVGERSVLDELDRPAAADRVRAVAADVVAVEAPIELKRLTRLVAGSFGLERVRQERHEAILALLPRDVQVDRVDGFAWPAHRHRRSWRATACLTTRPTDPCPTSRSPRSPMPCRPPGPGSNWPGTPRSCCARPWLCSGRSGSPTAPGVGSTRPGDWLGTGRIEALRAPCDRTVASSARRSWWGSAPEAWRLNRPRRTVLRTRRGMPMRTMSYSESRAKYAETLNAVVDDREEVVITRAGHEDVVMVALDDYESLKETAYLLRSPENARRLLGAIDRLEHGEGQAHALVDGESTDEA